jgi:DNA-binding XRE family transcriptional regulator
MTSMARKIGVSRHTLYRYEWGEDRPLLETALKLTAACGFKFTIAQRQTERALQFAVASCRVLARRQRLSQASLRTSGPKKRQPG